MDEKRRNQYFKYHKGDTVTRVFTKDLGRWKKGDIREYPIPTWQQIGRGNDVSLDSFSREIEDAARNLMTELPTISKPISRKVV